MSCLDVANCGNCAIVWHLILKTTTGSIKKHFRIEKESGFGDSLS